ncbi:hypothetical protein TREMEDRAFT_33615 [Tremella mesenterica DSM 1558]|uniref:uncharacterized protein n=1 Tax=Tremella mesenterica (strain ATCC 24925 / CBS 8224 / DSM 1558 / NBRC 9311 / NRRL Y-6157 / RJB 2259-6 / UBC 559-6) TaxID=578456 RepID=UPI0003F4A0DE|nr:uncharacterized protein TREMEDRAFT_33615 [Tremella mesenterica DSM 1558]EIW67270.1 hypothetical protein TREMEDRAFT_33615 [Tremella mesenterica DSM 1558]
MGLVIKATLRDETRRLAFESNKFPLFADIQQRLRTSFNLPSTAHTYWVNALFYPNDAQDARIMFKRHICDAAEYEAAQSPFTHGHFAAPALVFTVLLASDPRLEAIHRFHRANQMIKSVTDLETEIAELKEKHRSATSLFDALVKRKEMAHAEGDSMSVSFWSTRIDAKRQAVEQLQKELDARVEEAAKLKDSLDATSGPFEKSFKAHAEDESKEEQMRSLQTLEELAAWTAGNEQDHETLFPALESLFLPQPQRPTPQRGPSGSRLENSFHSLLNRVSDVMHNPETARSLVPTHEIKTMLDHFLMNLTNQLANTFDNAASPHHSTQRDVPGAYVSSSQPKVEAPAQTQAQTQTEEAKPASPSRGLGRGGFRHKHISCDGCLTGIRGMRYKCEQCADYDLCGSCLPLLSTSDLHPGTHTFRAMLHHGLEERIKLPSHFDPSVRHPATCDLCSETIRGVRWKCLSCPDWDCCGVCAATVNDTHPGHSFVKMYRAADYVDRSPDIAKQTSHPDIVCDGCEKQIHGPRYKCMHPSCPDYDLCEACEISAIPVHPTDHPMLKTKVPLKIDFDSTLNQNGLLVRGPGITTGGPYGGRHIGRERGARYLSLQRRAPYHHAGLVREQVVSPTKTSEDERPIPGSYVFKNVLEESPAPKTLAEPIIPDNDVPVNELRMSADALPESSLQGKMEQLKVKDSNEKAPINELRLDADLLPRPATTAPEHEDVPMSEASAGKSAQDATIHEKPSPQDIFAWARHVTIPFGCVLPAGAEFTKTWTVKHFASGKDYDFKKVMLRYDSSVDLGVMAPVTFDVCDVKEGQETEIKVEGLRVPQKAGEEIEVEWRIVDERGVVYGQPLRLR